MRLLMDAGFTARLSAAKNREEFIRMLKEREQARFAQPVPKKEYDCSKFLERNNKEKKISMLRRVEKKLPKLRKVTSLITELPRRFTAARTDIKKMKRHP